ncbi:hypothetical protein Pan44_47660 [Caulifigura coniformis]|uniref:DUF4062 domain-containing protein n=1 Tax=Caulifigura coniformis TaxID=2527983 RepID=A0A517SKQ1_9PLAN|nr:hypothetical protein Pan44_47660 [Caulifigura coniformis]
MAGKKLQVFVSSTYLDMTEERQAAVQAILMAGHIPAGMELFASGDQTQLEVIKRWIRESDAFFLILGGRYGSVEPLSGKSYVQLEYEYANDLGKSCFTAVITDAGLNRKLTDLPPGTLPPSKLKTRLSKEPLQRPAGAQRKQASAAGAPPGPGDDTPRSCAA